MTQLIFCKKDPLMGGIIMTKGQPNHWYTFGTKAILIFTPVANLSVHPLHASYLYPFVTENQPENPSSNLTQTHTHWDRILPEFN